MEAFEIQKSEPVLEFTLHQIVYIYNQPNKVSFALLSIYSKQNDISEICQEMLFFFTEDVQYNRTYIFQQKVDLVDKKD